MYRTAIAALLSSILWTPFASAETLWLSSLTEDRVRLACVADVGPEQTSVQKSPGTTTRVNGTAFPLDPARLYIVDLWSPPTEMEFVEQLANATICYRSPGCRAVLQARPGHEPARR
jgi:hypothetical protein